MFRIGDIQARVRRRPFRPFRVVTSSGDHVDVNHPELILVLDQRILVASPSPRGEGVGERITEVARLHITALEDLPAAEAPA